METNQQKMWGRICFKQFEKFFSQQWEPKKVSNITFFCNRFRGTIKLSLIMDKIFHNC